MKLRHVVLVDCLGQWVFNRGEASPGEQYLQVVVSASRQFRGLGHEEVKRRIVNELAELFPAAVPAALRRARVVTEHAATFSAVPGVDRWRPVQASHCRIYCSPGIGRPPAGPQPWKGRCGAATWPRKRFCSTRAVKQSWCRRICDLIQTQDNERVWNSAKLPLADPQQVDIRSPMRASRTSDLYPSASCCLRWQDVAPPPLQTCWISSHRVDWGPRPRRLTAAFARPEPSYRRPPYPGQHLHPRCLRLQGHCLEQCQALCRIRRGPCPHPFGLNQALHPHPRPRRFPRPVASLPRRFPTRVGRFRCRAPNYFLFPPRCWLLLGERDAGPKGAV